MFYSFTTRIINIDRELIVFNKLVHMFDFNFNFTTMPLLQSIWNTNLYKECIETFIRTIICE